MSDGSDTDRAQAVAELARERGVRVAVAESLTAGRVSSVLGQGEGASEWYRGGVVAYAEDVKFEVLGVTPGPVVTDLCAREMAEGVRRLLQADVAVSLTGVGGPGPQEDRPAGTVHLAVATGDGTRSLETRLPGEPPDVVDGATRLALDELLRAIEEMAGEGVGEAAG